MRFSVAWWNTGISPPKGATKTSRIAPAVKIISRMFTEFNVDLLCLGETDATTLKILKGLMPANKLTFVDRAQDGDGTKFQMAFIYDNAKVDISSSKFITESVAQRKKRLAQTLDVTLVEGSKFTLFVVHWPSRVMIPADAGLRTTLGFALRKKMDEILFSDPSRRIVLLGDFNDEPYNESVASMLSATRDRQRVEADSRLLYNPLWRSYAPPELYSKDSRPKEPAVGTYYFHGGIINRWHIFDQVLVSSGFLGSDVWHLSEAETRIWDSPSDLVFPPAKYVDHLPIFGVFERETT